MGSYYLILSIGRIILASEEMSNRVFFVTVRKLISSTMKDLWSISWGNSENRRRRLLRRTFIIKRQILFPRPFPARIKYREGCWYSSEITGEFPHVEYIDKRVNTTLEHFSVHVVHIPEGVLWRLRSILNTLRPRRPRNDFASKGQPHSLRQQAHDRPHKPHLPSRRHAAFPLCKRLNGTPHQFLHVHRIEASILCLDKVLPAVEHFRPDRARLNDCDIDTTMTLLTPPPLLRHAQPQRGHKRLRRTVWRAVRGCACIDTTDHDHATSLRWMRPYRGHEPPEEVCHAREGCHVEGNDGFVVGDVVQ